MEEGQLVSQILVTRYLNHLHIAIGEIIFTQTYTKDMHSAVGCIMHYEFNLISAMEILLEYINDTPKMVSFAKKTQDVFQVNKFNEILQDYFEASMTASEGNVMHATKYTKAKFDLIKDCHLVLTWVVSHYA